MVTGARLSGIPEPQLCLNPGHPPRAGLLSFELIIKPGDLQLPDINPVHNIGDCIALATPCLVHFPEWALHTSLDLQSPLELRGREGAAHVDSEAPRQQEIQKELRRQNGVSSSKISPLELNQHVERSGGKPPQGPTLFHIVIWYADLYNFFWVLSGICFANPRLLVR